MTNNDSIRFNNLYCELKEKEKDIFQTITMKMLKVNFLLRKVDNDKYVFILQHKELFELFFEYLNFSFMIKEDKELAYIKSNDDSLVTRLKKNETLCLLILRLLYQQKLEEVSLSSYIEITVKELQDQLFAVDFEKQSNDRVKKSKLNEMLITFKQHNIIYYKDDLAFDNTIIEIYPSIEVAMDFNKMEEILNRLDLIKGGFTDD